MFEKQAQTVERALQALRDEGRPELAAELEEDQSAGATGLEVYGLTKNALERFLRREKLSPPTRRALQAAVKAVEVMFTR